MPIIAIDMLESGMILKESVHDRTGRLLLPKGEALTDKHLKIFKTWGVVSADILANTEELIGSDTQETETNPAIIEETNALTSGIFSHNDTSSPIVRELLRICVARRLANEL